MDFIEHNRKAWNRVSNQNSPWAIPVSSEQIRRAQKGDWELYIAGPKPVPGEWLAPVKDKVILCLASGGGQQAPILAAAGAEVVLFDASEEQLKKDKDVCSRNGLDIQFEQGNMMDLSRFDDESFDLVLNPVSNIYVADLQVVWEECARVLKPGGRLLAGSINPLNFLFEENDGSDDRGLTVIHKLPFVEHEALSEIELHKAVEREMIFTWSHSLEEIIGGQLKAGLTLRGLFESKRTDARAPAINRFSPTYIATFATKE